MEFRKEF